MSKFVDKLGREWTLDVTMGSADQVEKDLGIDLLKWIEDASSGADNRTVFRIVGSLCAEQIAAAGLDLRGFMDGFDGATLEAAGDALVTALLFFSLPARVAGTVVPKLRTVKETLQDRMVAAIEAQDFRSLAGPSPASAASTPAPSPSGSCAPPL